MFRSGHPHGSREKVWACQIIEFLGLLVDTLLMIICIPQVKLSDIREHLAAILSQNEVTAKSLKSLVGKLNFMCKAFPIGRPFIYHIYDAVAGLPKMQSVTILQEIEADVKMWFKFTKLCKGWLLILDVQQSKSKTLSVFTDASANPNLGCRVNTPSTGWWSYGQWDPQFFSQFNSSIDFLKMYAILIFLEAKRSQLADYQLRFFSNNMPTVNTLTTRSNHSK